MSPILRVDLNFWWNVIRPVKGMRWDGSYDGVLTPALLTFKLDHLDMFEKWKAGPECGQQ